MEQPTEQQEQAATELIADIFRQLLMSARFQSFLDLNFEIRKNINEETKTIEYYVIEVPHEVVKSRIKEKMEEATPKVELATNDDLSKILKGKN